MNQDIHYTGYSASPSDYECRDGELSMSLNLINEQGGSLRTLCKPAELFDVSAGYLVFIHKVNSRTHYLRYNPKSHVFGWLATKDEGNLTRVNDVQLKNLEGEEFVGCTCVGLIVVVSTDRNIHYFRFDTGKDAYVYLGTRLPEVNLQFGLRLHLASHMIEDVDYEMFTSNGFDSTTPEQGLTTILTETFEMQGSDFTIGKYSYAESRIREASEQVHITKGTEYTVNALLSSQMGLGAKSLTLFGKKDADSEWEWLGAAYPTPTEGSSMMRGVFTAKDDYCLFAYQYKERVGDDGIRAEESVKGNLYIMEGSTGADVSKTRIKYTRESLEALMAGCNVFLKQYGTKKNRFIYPFFLRYALRMYDGSYARLSEPVLLIPNSGAVPTFRFGEVERLGNCLILSAFAADIDFRLHEAIPQQWRDLIMGVDIFVSSPVYTMDTGVTYDPMKQNAFTYPESFATSGTGDLYAAEFPVSGEVSDANYKRYLLEEALSQHASTTNCPFRLSVAARTQEEINDKLLSTCVFRKIAELTFEDLEKAAEGGDIRLLELKEHSLEALDTKPTLEDTPLYYEGYGGALVSTFNSRLHITSARTILPAPKLPGLQTGLCKESPFDETVTTVRAWVFLKTEDGTKYAKGMGEIKDVGNWFYYPDSRAYALLLAGADSAGEVKQTIYLELKSHDFLNGSYWYSGSLGTPAEFSMDTHEIPREEPGRTDRVKAFSTLYLSDVNNPFVFEAASAVHIPVTKVESISHAAKALSQGQFGQFPLYAFTDEGVWALTVTSEGKYSSVQPITRDVCINPEGITQIDSAVLFPTDRGIMLLSGSQTECISDVLNTATPFDITMLPHMDELHAMLGDDHKWDSCIPTVPFLTFLQDCRMIYDYVHQRIIVYNVGYTYAYVYSLKSKLWGMMHSDICSKVNSYPDALAVSAHGRLVDFSADTDSAQPGLLLTRPLKLGDGGVLKTIDTVIQRGNFQRGHVQSVLYASRNLTHWHMIWSSRDHYLRGFRGTPYKYFRLALVCHLTPAESLTGASVGFTPRLLNQLR